VPEVRAARGGHVAACGFFLGSDKFKAKAARTNCGRTPLHRAAGPRGLADSHMRKPDVARLLLSSFASLTEQDQRGDTPLSLAYEQGWRELFLASAL